MKLSLILLLLAGVAYPFVSSALDTMNTAESLKFGFDKVKWIGFYGSILNVFEAGFNIDVYIKIENPTKSNITIDFINLVCSLEGKQFATINYTVPLSVKANSNVIKPIRIKSATTDNLKDMIINLITTGKIPTQVHLKGTVSANTWKASIDTDCPIIP